MNGMGGMSAKWKWSIVIVALVIVLVMLFILLDYYKIISIYGLAVLSLFVVVCGVVGLVIVVLKV